MHIPVYNLSLCIVIWQDSLSTHACKHYIVSKIAVPMQGGVSYLDLLTYRPFNPVRHNTGITDGI